MGLKGQDLKKMFGNPEWSVRQGVAQNWALGRLQLSPTLERLLDIHPCPQGSTRRLDPNFVLGARYLPSSRALRDWTSSFLNFIVKGSPKGVKEQGWL